MASSEKGKKLSDLLVIELRNYLKQRQLDHIGTKAVLVERLQQAIISEGNDPNTYIFLNDKTVNVQIETAQEKEQMSESIPSGLDENSNQVEKELDEPEINPETNFENTPMEIEINGNVSTQPKSEIKCQVASQNVDNTEKIELETEINESFVLMIDELISEKFLEETQNEEIGEPDFVDANDLTLDESEKANEDQLLSDIVDHEIDVDPLDVENEEEKQLSNTDLTMNNSKENEDEKKNHQDKVCNKELIVVVQREDLIENKRKLMIQQSDMENMLPLGIKIKEEIIELSDDDMNSEDNFNLNDIKPEPFDENKTIGSKMDEITTNIEAEEIKSDVLEPEEQATNVETLNSSADKESSKIKQGTYHLNIENLISSVKAQELRQLLCDYAKVLEVKVIHDNKKNYCHAFAKVEVNNLDEMLEKLNALEYKGSVLSVTNTNDKNNTSGNKEVQRIRPTKGSKKKKQEGEEKMEPKELDRNLWVTNLLQNTKAQDIKQLLSQHAKVIGVKVVKSSSDPSKNCYGYVTLESKSDVDLCIQKLDKTTYNGRVIRLSATKKAPVLDSVTDKNVKKSPEKDVKGSNNLKSSNKKKTPDKNTKKSDDVKKDDDKKSDSKKETYEKNRSDRDRHHREKERTRLEEERMRQDVEHAREMLRRQREEARLLEREREKIRKEREYLERQRSEILRLERERQRIEREKIEKEKEELRRQQQRLEEARRAEKRASTSSSSSVPSKRSYVSPKRDKPKKNELLDFPKRSTDFPKENDDTIYPKRHGEYSKRIDEYSKRADSYPKRTSDYPKRLDDYPKRSDINPRRVDDYSKRVTEDYPKRFDHYTKPDEIYVKEDYHKRDEFPNYKREDRAIRMDFKRGDYSGHSSHHVPSAVNNSGYKFEATYHPDRDKLIRAPPRKDLITKDSKPIVYNDRTEISSTEAYRSIVRDDRDRERKSGVDYNYKNDNRMPLLKETPRFKDDGSSWTTGAAPVKTLRDVDPNAPKDTWWRKWDGQWSAGTSTEYPGMNYNSGTTCPPPPGINNYPMNNHFGNYRKY